ncbi:unnamed protein product [Gongylonema pulchrum]|uniref:BZIP domain-containing protein n=1 Tax=Gongylonema pulchrum TaxID=637853 RepID=A0A183DQV9_9BILA|nr:unnamed protein product [Gongylonema pulchrum]
MVLNTVLNKDLSTDTNGGEGNNDLTAPVLSPEGYYSSTEETGKASTDGCMRSPAPSHPDISLANKQNPAHDLENPRKRSRERKFENECDKVEALDLTQKRQKRISQ